MTVDVPVLQLKRAITATVAMPVYNCSQVQARDTPLADSAELSHQTTAAEIITTSAGAATLSLIEIHSKTVVALFIFDVKLRGFTSFSGCMDVAIFNFEVDIFITAIKVGCYEKWTYNS